MQKHESACRQRKVPCHECTSRKAVPLSQLTDHIEKAHGWKPFKRGKLANYRLDKWSCDASAVGKLSMPIQLKDDYGKNVTFYLNCVSRDSKGFVKIRYIRVNTANQSAAAR